jgi:hypothetical protein
MLYREIIAVCSEIHTKHINTLCGQNVELLNVKTWRYIKWPLGFEGLIQIVFYRLIPTSKSVHSSYIKKTNLLILCVISDSCRGVSEIFALLGCYAA